MLPQLPQTVGGVEARRAAATMAVLQRTTLAV